MFSGCFIHVPCLICPSDNMWHSRQADAPWCTHFSTVITPFWITQQISVEKCTHRGTLSHRKRQTMFKIIPWTKHHNTVFVIPEIRIHWTVGKGCRVVPAAALQIGPPPGFVQRGADVHDCQRSPGFLCWGEPVWRGLSGVLKNKCIILFYFLCLEYNY